MKSHSISGLLYHHLCKSHFPAAPHPSFELFYLILLIPFVSELRISVRFVCLQIHFSGCLCLLILNSLLSSYNCALVSSLFDYTHSTVRLFSFISTNTFIRRLEFSTNLETTSTLTFIRNDTDGRYNIANLNIIFKRKNVTPENNIINEIL